MFKPNSKPRRLEHVDYMYEKESHKLVVSKFQFLLDLGVWYSIYNFCFFLERTFMAFENEIF